MAAGDIPNQGPQATPAGDQDDDVTSLKKYERLSAKARKHSKAC